MCCTLSFENNRGVIEVFADVTTVSGKDCPVLLNSQGFCSCHESDPNKKTDAPNKMGELKSLKSV